LLNTSTEPLPRWYRQRTSHSAGALGAALTFQAWRRRVVQWAGTCTTRSRRARGDQPTNAALAAWFGACRDTKSERKPRGARPRAFQGDIHEETSRDQGALDAPILSQGTNQARRGSRKRLGPPGDDAAFPLLFFEPEIRSFCDGHHSGRSHSPAYQSPSNGLSYRNVRTADMCTWLCIGTACAGFFAGGLLVLLMARLPTDKHTAL
jgi:hypothetical protein